jgi:hypothetical protein
MVVGLIRHGNGARLTCRLYVLAVSSTPIPR